MDNLIFFERQIKKHKNEIKELSQESARQQEVLKTLTLPEDSRSVIHLKKVFNLMDKLEKKYSIENHNALHNEFIYLNKKMTDHRIAILNLIDQLSDYADVVLGTSLGIQELDSDTYKYYVYKYSAK